MGFTCRTRGSHWWWTALILIAWLSVWIQRTAAQGPGGNVVNATLGKTATLPAPVTAGILFVNWFRGTVQGDAQRIIRYVASTGAQTPGAQHTGRESVLSDGSLRITDLRTSDAGDYTASVALTDATIVTGPRQLNVFGTDTSPGSSPGLSAGAIVGIVIGVLAVIIIVCVLVYIFVIKKPASGAPDARDSTEMAPKSKEASGSPKANGATPEIQYSSVNFVPKQVTPAKPIAPENTVYSEVRRS